VLEARDKQLCARLARWASARRRSTRALGVMASSRPVPSLSLHLRMALIWVVVCLECSCASKQLHEVTVFDGKTFVGRCGDDFYPTEALRLKQEGVVVARLCVDADSEIEKPTAVLVSSGSPLLDAGAQKCLQSGRYKSAQNKAGKPVDSCRPMEVRFALEPSRN